LLKALFDMIIFRNLSDIEEKLANAVVTIGNFDGVHLGHREIFRRVRATNRFSFWRRW